MKKVIIALLLSIVNCQLSTAQIGTWRNYLAYYDVQQIQAAGDELFVLASNGLYQYNKKDQSITTYDKVKGLSDTHISHIRWCQQAKRLIATYSNTNIDLIDIKGNITNISDIYTKVITGDKTINNVYIYNQYAYLACGFGIVKVNVKDANISESYMLGFPVTAITISDDNIYAKANNAVYTGSLNTNLIDKSNWTQTTIFPSFDEDTSDYDNNIDLVKTLKPGGPKYNYFGFLKFTNNQLYSCGGGTTSIEKPACIQVLKDNDWIIYQDYGISEQTGVSYVNITCLDIDPLDDSHLFAGSRNGLYEFRNGKYSNFFNSKNSLIESFDDKNLDYELVTGVKFDVEGNLWILNSQAATQSIIKYSDGKFTSYAQPNLMKLTYGSFKNRSNSNLSSIYFDSRNLMWFVNNAWRLPALYYYNVSDNTLKNYETFINQDGTNFTPSNGVRCVTEDLSNNIWICTDQGPLMLERNEINNNSSVFTQVKVPRNDGTNYADYLLSSIDITAIAIDGGGRKWFGTNGNGVYLISADNMTQLQHFTTDNSKLLSNVIQSIAINNSTGEVYIGTENGLCSYFSDAISASTEMTSDNVWAYPNPVTPDYTGLITVTGLTLNADVKIVSSNGALIAEGKSNGGSFTWDGNDKKGRRVASGVYMVVTATSSGEKGTVCKIAIIN